MDKKANICKTFSNAFFIFIEITLKIIPEARIYISPHWCMQWHGTEWVISLYLIWWWPYLLTHKSSIRLQGIKIHHLISSWCLCLFVYEMKQVYPEMFHLTYNIFEYPWLLHISIWCFRDVPVINYALCFSSKYLKCWCSLIVLLWLSYAYTMHLICHVNNNQCAIIGGGYISYSNPFPFNDQLHKTALL